jgi:hypothetical protein
MPCAVKSAVLKPVYRALSIGTNHVDSHIYFDKTGFHTSERDLSEFDL